MSPRVFACNSLHWRPFFGAVVQILWCMNQSKRITVSLVFAKAEKAPKSFGDVAQTFLLGIAHRNSCQVFVQSLYIEGKLLYITQQIVICLLTNAEICVKMTVGYYAQKEWKYVPKTF